MTRDRQRSIRLIRPLRPGEPGILRVRDGDDAFFYTVREIPCDIGGRGFAVHRLGLGTMYHVRIGLPIDCSCDCPGFTYHSRCKHVLGLLKLAERGEL